MPTEATATTKVPDVNTPAGDAWLRETLLAFLRKHPGASERRILLHVERRVLIEEPTSEAELDYGFRAVDLLFEMVEAGELRWDEQKGNPDAPLLYWVVEPRAVPTRGGR